MLKNLIALQIQIYPSYLSFFKRCFYHSYFSQQGVWPNFYLIQNNLCDGDFLENKKSLGKLCIIYSESDC